MAEPAVDTTKAVAKPNGNGAADTSHEVGVALERVMLMGDLTPLTPGQRSEYYMRVCQSIGLNPYTRPFGYIKLNGKLTLYAFRDCADQLRKLHGISIQIVDRKLTDGLLSIHVRATSKDGRSDEDFAVIPAPAKLVGEAGANLIMKCVTKAKRRVTLSICGLGMLDETEVVTIPGAELVEVDSAGEIKPAAALPKRKSSAEGKRDGSVKRFNELRAKIEKSEGAIECMEIWKAENAQLTDMARGWFTTLAEEFVSKMDDHGVQIDVDQDGWPILPAEVEDKQMQAAE